MKEITDESVVKNIIGINLNNKRNVPYFKIIINDGIVFLIFRKLLILLIHWWSFLDMLIMILIKK